VVRATQIIFVEKLCALAETKQGLDDIISKSIV